MARASAAGDAWSCSRPSAGASASSWPWPRRTPRSRSQTHLLSRGNRQQVVLEELERALALPGPPNRIEGFDISTIQGSETVASMVVWQDGDMKKDDYKRYQDPHRDGHRRLRVHARGADPPLRPRAGGRRRAAGPRPARRRARPARRRGSRCSRISGLDYLPIASLAKRAEEVYLPDRLAAARARSRARPRCRRSRRSATRRTASRSPTTRSCASAGPSPPCSTRFPAWDRPCARACSRRWAPPRGVEAASVAELASVPKVTPKLAQADLRLLPSGCARPGNPRRAGTV